MKMIQAEPDFDKALWLQTYHRYKYVTNYVPKGMKCAKCNFDLQYSGYLGHVANLRLKEKHFCVKCALRKNLYRHTCEERYFASFIRTYSGEKFKDNIVDYSENYTIKPLEVKA